MLYSQRVRIVKAVEVVLNRKLDPKEYHSLMGSLEKILPEDPTCRAYEMALVRREIENRRSAGLL